MYWEQQEDTHNANSITMSRNRFDVLMRHIHVADNDRIIVCGEFGKIRPLYNLINESFIKFFPIQKDLSIHESIIPYYGKHSWKQCIRGKPIQFGYKQWVIATPLGYAAYLDLYHGAGAGYYRKLGVGHESCGLFAKGTSLSPLLRQFLHRLLD
ncbi:PiggyBac transposable element derived 3 [Plakobranchus ocellatus]|uniref:PiggyBac transposable element derived 3 n=1 Tax=Plakobranchus ocellatus TaxID=259542 RepID=A0AAV4A840_9GAST|nr:PiggyBac transposable element derived 3 [Plakobranchus ocellatus]